MRRRTFPTDRWWRYEDARLHKKSQPAPSILSGQLPKPKQYRAKKGTGQDSFALGSLPVFGRARDNPTEATAMTHAPPGRPSTNQSPTRVPSPPVFSRSDQSCNRDAIRSTALAAYCHPTEGRSGRNAVGGHCGPPWGVDSEPAHTRRAGRRPCVLVERTGESAAPPTAGRLESPRSAADSPSDDHPEPAGQRAVPSSYNRPQDASTDPLPVYRLSYRPEAVRHPTCSKRVPKINDQSCDSLRTRLVATHAVFGYDEPTPKVPLGGSPIPRSLGSLVPFACLSRLRLAFFKDKTRAVSR